MAKLCRTTFHHTDEVWGVFPFLDPTAFFGAFFFQRKCVCFFILRGVFIIVTDDEISDRLRSQLCATRWRGKLSQWVIFAKLDCTDFATAAPLLVRPAPHGPALEWSVFKAIACSCRCRSLMGCYGWLPYRPEGAHVVMDFYLHLIELDEICKLKAIKRQ